ncbi:MAG: thiamine phosphate synthase [Acidobacteria bacterium]|nr:thiamine phosphate synthase [Acidobacteriota bacterium]
MKFLLPKIYPITDRRLSGMPHAELIRQLARGGASLIQVREKGLPSGEFLAMARDAVAAGRESDVKIIINDRVDIAMMSGAAGVHLGQNDLPPEAAREILGDAAIIGYSTHSVEQAAAAAKMPIDYIAIGPIYPTDTKEDTEPVIGIEGIAAVRAAIGSIPLVAIGGISNSRISGVLAAGADSVAMISALYGDNSDIPSRLSSLIGIANNI